MLGGATQAPSTASRATTSPPPGFFSSGGSRARSTTLSASLVEAHRNRDGRLRRFHPCRRPRVRRRQAPRRAPRAQPWCAPHPSPADETTTASVPEAQKSLWIGPARARDAVADARVASLPKRLARLRARVRPPRRDRLDASRLPARASRTDRRSGALGTISATTISGTSRPSTRIRSGPRITRRRARRSWTRWRFFASSP